MPPRGWAVAERDCGLSELTFQNPRAGTRRQRHNPGQDKAGPLTEQPLPFDFCVLRPPMSNMVMSPRLPGWGAFPGGMTCSLTTSRRPCSPIARCISRRIAAASVSCQSCRTLEQ